MIQLLISSDSEAICALRFRLNVSVSHTNRQPIKKLISVHVVNPLTGYGLLRNGQNTYVRMQSWIIMQQAKIPVIYYINK